VLFGSQLPPVFVFAAILIALLFAALLVALFLVAPSDAFYVAPLSAVHFFALPVVLFHAGLVLSDVLSFVAVPLDVAASAHVHAALFVLEPAVWPRFAQAGPLLRPGKYAPSRTLQNHYAVAKADGWAALRCLA
jgi:hypothetical protein